MAFTALVLLEIILIFIPIRNSVLKKVEFIYSLGVGVWGIKKMFDFYNTAMTMWTGYFKNLNSAIPNQSSIQFNGIEIIKLLNNVTAAIAIGIVIALIILTLVLRRFDGNIDKAVFIITILVLSASAVAIMLIGIFVSVKVPYFMYVSVIQAVNLLSLIMPILFVFNFECRDKTEYPDKLGE